ncbi:intein-containing maestro heat-like repeat family member 1 precursor [Anaeramoeba ignava]|uniref:Intein-containing maestro heat-like repeat family member 1 n=1 Tax=Anaeramoeba ignava TaxID=1746090 RepID=A0A9Q0L914_ANAIG|nr:intein-containing maestro heat-like repeat family member 1 precursor [Anaeramoeba ignava]
MKIFGKKTSRAQALIRSNIVIQTGGMIDEMVKQLIISVSDTNKTVRSTVSDALIEIGNHKTPLVVSSILNHISKEKLNKEIRIHFIQLMSTIVEQKIERIPSDLALNIIQFSIDEMTSSNDNNQDNQIASSNTLVALGKRFHKEVIDQLLLKFQIGTIPHYHIITCFGEFTSSNPLVTVPRLGEIFTRVLPILSSIKSKKMQAAFAKTMGNFFEAIIHYVANKDSVDIKSITYDSFQTEVSTLYTWLFDSWMLKSSDKMIRLAAAQSMGPLLIILKADKLRGEISRFLSALLKLFQKEKNRDHLPLVRCLNNVFEAMKNGDIRLSEQSLTSVFTTIFPLICVPVDPTDQNSYKIHNELLRCFAIISETFIHYLFRFLLPKMEAKDTQTKEGAVKLITHLVTHSSNELKDMKETIVASVKNLIQTTGTNYALSAAVCDLIVSMANQMYLYVAGGKDLVMFVLKCASIGDEEIDAFDKKNKKRLEKQQKKEKEKTKNKVYSLEMSPRSLRSHADRILLMMAQKLLDREEYLMAQPMLCKSTGVVAMKKRAAAEDPNQTDYSDEFFLDFDQLVNLPKPQHIYARLLSMSILPYDRNDPGANALSLLRVLSPVLHPSLNEAFEKKHIQRLQNYLEKHHAKNFGIDKWRGMLVKFVRSTVTTVNDDEWNSVLAEAFGRQLEISKNSEARRTLHIFLCICLQKSRNNDLVIRKLRGMFQELRKMEALEREGFAVGYGLVAGSHFDRVLDALANIIEVDMVVKRSGFFQKKDKSGPEMLGMRESVILGFGYAVANAPSKTMVSRLEISVLKQLMPLVSNFSSSANSPVTTMESIAVSFDNMATALRSTNQDPNYHFERREEFLDILLGFISPTRIDPNHSMRVSDSEKHQEESEHGDSYIKTVVKEAAIKNDYNNLVVLSLRAIVALVLLKPLLPPEQEKKVVEALLKLWDVGVAGALQSTKEKKSRHKHRHKKEDKQDSARSYSHGGTDLIMQGFTDVLSSILYMDTSGACFHRIFHYIAPKLRSSNPLQRSRACETVEELAMNFIDFRTNQRRKKHRDIEKDLVFSEKDFHRVGEVLAVMIPRCFDPEIPIRSHAFHTVEMMLYIDYLLRLASKNKTPFRVVKPPKPLLRLALSRERIDTVQTQTMLETAREIAVAITSLFKRYQITQFLVALVDGFADIGDSGSNAAALIYNECITIRGKEELTDQVSNVFSSLRGSLAQISNPQTLNATLHAAQTLARFNITSVIGTLFSVPPPLSPLDEKCFVSIASDSELAPELLKILLDTMNNQTLVTERMDTNSQKLVYEPTIPPQTATAALGGILESGCFDDILAQRPAHILGAILMRFGSVVGTYSNRLSNESTLLAQTTETLKQFFNSLNMKDAVSLLSVVAQSFLFKREVLKKLPDEIDEKTIPDKENTQDSSPKNEDEKSNENIQIQDDEKEEPPKETKQNVDKEIIPNTFMQIPEQPSPKDLLEKLYKNEEQFDDPGFFEKNLQLDAWTALSSGENFEEGLQLIVRQYVLENPQHIVKLCEFVYPYLTKNIEGQRIAATSVFAELVNHVSSLPKILSMVLNCLFSRQNDPCPKVVKCAIRGLGNIVSVDSEVSSKYIGSIFGMILPSTEGKHVDVEFEAMKNLKRISEVLPISVISPHLITLCVAEDTNVLLADGITSTSISNLSETFSSQNLQISTVDPESLVIKKTNINNFFQLEKTQIERRLFVVTTISGRKITVSEDHPFLVSFSSSEFSPAKFLTSDDSVVIAHTLKNIPDILVKNSSSFDILSVSQFKSSLENTITQSQISENLDILESKQLIPLSSSDQRIPTISRILPFLTRSSSSFDCFRDDFISLILQNEPNFLQDFLSLDLIQKDQNDLTQFLHSQNFNAFLSLLFVLCLPSHQIFHWLPACSSQSKREWLAGFQSRFPEFSLLIQNNDRDFILSPIKQSFNDPQEFVFAKKLFTQALNLYHEFGIDCELEISKILESENIIVLNFAQNLRNILNLFRIIGFRLQREEKTEEIMLKTEYLLQRKFEEKKKRNSKENEIMKFSNFQKLVQVHHPFMLIPLESVVETPKQALMDLQTESIHHTFIANGFVTHNCSRTRQTFMSPHPKIRAASINLFASLAKFGIENNFEQRISLVEQFHNNFPSLMIYLRDSNNQVRESVKLTFRNYGLLIFNNEINSLFQSNVINPKRGIDYENFLDSLCKLLARIYSPRISNYLITGIQFFTSDEPQIRANSALVIAYFLKHTPKDMRNTINKGHICSQIILLLKDKSPLVKTDAARALSLLYDY